MKKIWILLLSGLLALALYSCGNSPESGPDSGSSTGGDTSAESALEESLPEKEASEGLNEESSDQSFEESSEESSASDNQPVRELINLTADILKGAEDAYALRFDSDAVLAMQYGAGDEVKTRLFDTSSREILSEDVGNAGIVTPNSYDREIPLEDGRIAYITEDMTQVRIRSLNGSGDTLLLDAAGQEGVDSFWIILAKNNFVAVCGNTMEYEPTSFVINADTGESVNLSIPGTTIPQSIEGDKILFVRENIMSAPPDQNLYVYDTREKTLLPIPAGSETGSCRAVLSPGGNSVLALTNENFDEQIASFSVFDTRTGDKVNSALVRNLPAVSEGMLAFAINQSGTALSVLSYLYPGDFTHSGVFLYNLE